MSYLGKFKRNRKIILLRYVICVSLFYPKFKPLFMDKIQQLIMSLRMQRASIKTMLTNYQMIEDTNQAEIDKMLDDLSELTKTIEFLEEKLKQGEK